LHAAVAHVAHYQIRNRGTVGGGLAHADPAAELPGVAVTCEGEITLFGPVGSRTVRAGDFFTGPLSTLRQPDEIITELHLPKWPSSRRWAFREYARRDGDFALAGILLFYDEDRQGALSNAHVGVIGACPRAYRLTGGGNVAERPHYRRWSDPARGVDGRRRGRPSGRFARRRRLPSRPRRDAHRARLAGRGSERRRVMRVSFRVNGDPVAVDVEPRLHLADCLREVLGLTGTHLGCEHGACGACTVIVDGAAVRACLMLTVQTEGASVVTVEGLSSDKALSPLQTAFRKHHALQCGFCTPGMLTTAHALLTEEPDADADRIRSALSGNLCRCTGYIPIVEAVLEARAAYRKANRP
jgi:carbon-monoxide dehydrogenase small subunit